MRVSWKRGAVVLALFLTAGCSRRAEISGRVRYQDKPVLYGSVLFVGNDDVPVKGEIRPDGTYTAQGVLRGENRVAVFSPDPDPPAREKKGGKSDEPIIDRSKWFPIPDKYSDFRESGLKLTVDAASMPYDIDLP